MRVDGAHGDGGRDMNKPYRELALVPSQTPGDELLVEIRAALEENKESVKSLDKRASGLLSGDYDRTHEMLSKRRAELLDRLERVLRPCGRRWWKCR